MASAEPKRPLKRMFDAVPARYDFLNRLLTLRMDERWRDQAARRCLENSARRVLDLGCGTGDLTLRLARTAPAGTEIVGLDFSPPMLAVAREKAARAGVGEGLNLVEGDATAMAFPDDHFDAVGIAFAFRNITWRNPITEQALGEVRRVLRPGGRFVIVESSQPENAALRLGYHAYLRTVVAGVGGILSGQKSAYRYLAESARHFYSPEEVCDLLRSAGFSSFEVDRKMGGVAAVHVAV